MKKKIKQLIKDFKILKRKKYIYMRKIINSINYRKKIEVGKNISGCITKTWIINYYKKKKIYFIGNSKSEYIRSIIYIIANICSGIERKKITRINFSLLLNIINLRRNLSFNRTNSFFYIIREIKNGN